MFTPLMAAASYFSLGSILSSTATPVGAAGSAYTSQTVPLLSPAVHLDPRPSVGGGDINMVGGRALLAFEGPEGTAADIADVPTATTISVYTVHSGDTLASIAKMFGVSVNTIVWANDIDGPISVGQELVILPVSGIRYTVKKGDTLASIAKKYGADEEEIAQFNDIGEGLAVGSTLLIPHGELAPAPKPAVAAKPKSGVTQSLLGGGGPSISGYFGWPVGGGVLTQGLHGWNGIDIGASRGTPVYAAAGGTVIIAKGNGAWNGGYGNYVVISHSNGTQTLYGHLSSVTIGVGSSVSKGELIGKVGNTGKSTGPHLHFEVRGAANPFAK